MTVLSPRNATELNSFSVTITYWAWVFDFLNIQFSIKFFSLFFFSFFSSFFTSYDPRWSEKGFWNISWNVICKYFTCVIHCVTRSIYNAIFLYALSPRKDECNLQKNKRQMFPNVTQRLSNSLLLCNTFHPSLYKKKWK